MIDWLIKEIGAVSLDFTMREFNFNLQQNWKMGLTVAAVLKVQDGTKHDGVKGELWSIVALSLQYIERQEHTSSRWWIPFLSKTFTSLQAVGVPEE